MGVHADGGLKILIFQKFCFGPKSPPKAPFGVKIGATDAENREESKNNPNNFPKFCSGPKSGPKAPFGVKIGASDAENHEESENKLKIFPKHFQNFQKMSQKFKNYGKISFSRPPSAWTPIGAFLSQVDP